MSRNGSGLTEYLGPTLTLLNEWPLVGVAGVMFLQTTSPNSFSQTFFGFAGDAADAGKTGLPYGSRTGHLLATSDFASDGGLDAVDFGTIDS
jgi:hypothetical protein